MSSSSEAADGGQALVVRGRAQRRARLFGQPAPVLDHVQPDDPDPCGDQEPDDELADQPQADDQGGVAELGLSAADPLHGDRADGGEGGMLWGDAARYRGA